MTNVYKELSKEEKRILFFLAFIGGLGPNLLKVSGILLSGGELPTYQFFLGMLILGFFGIVSQLISQVHTRKAALIVGMSLPGAIGAGGAGIAQAQERTTHPDQMGICKIEIRDFKKNLGLEATIKYHDNSTEIVKITNNQTLIESEKKISTISVKGKRVDQITVVEVPNVLVLDLDQKRSGFKQAFGAPPEYQFTISDKSVKYH